MLDAQVIAAIIGAGAVLAAQAMWRWWTRPRLLLDFNGNNAAYCTHTDAVTDSAGGLVTVGSRFTRVRVTNRGSSIAKDCRAYLIKVEKQDGTLLWRPTIFCDTLRLKWSAQPIGEELLPIDLPKGVDQFVDVLATMGHLDEYLLQVDVHLFRYRSLFKEHGVFRYTILVAGDGVDPVTVRVAFRWSGVWDRCEAWDA